MSRVRWPLFRIQLPPPISISNQTSFLSSEVLQWHDNITCSLHLESLLEEVCNTHMFFADGIATCLCEDKCPRYFIPNAICMASVTDVYGHRMPDLGSSCLAHTNNMPLGFYVVLTYESNNSTVFWKLPVVEYAVNI